MPAVTADTLTLPRLAAPAATAVAIDAHRQAPWKIPQRSNAGLVKFDLQQPPKRIQLVMDALHIGDIGDIRIHQTVGFGTEKRLPQADPQQRGARASQACAVDQHIDVAHDREGPVREIPRQHVDALE